MSSKLLTGTVSFVHHEKQYVSIAYKPDGGGKEKTINGLVSPAIQEAWKKAGLVKKTHRFQVGDTVNFVLQLSDKGDKMVASSIQYIYNAGLERMLHKAGSHNHFNGYIKVVEGKFYIKEIESYLFFPLAISPWQEAFTDKQVQQAVAFTLEQSGKKVIAALLDVEYIPEYHKAMQLYKKQTVIEATVCAVNAFGIYVNIIGEKIQAKIPASKIPKDASKLNPGDKINIRITHLTPMKIVVELV